MCLQKVVALGAASVLCTVLSAVAGTGTASAGGPESGTAAATRPGAPNKILREVFATRKQGHGTSEPAATARCADLLTEPNEFGDPRPNVDMITNDGTVTTGSQTGCKSAQNEPHVAVNPFNPRNIVAGANDYRVFSPRENANDSSGWAYASFDGGRTWLNSQLPGLTVQTGGVGALTDSDAAGDPVLAFGPGNTVYYVNLVFSRFNAMSGIAVNVSRDGGRTWGAPVIIHTDGVTPDGQPLATPFFNDKPWITADPLSGRVWVSWTKFEFDAQGAYVQSPIVISSSRDFGRTWSPATTIGTTLDTFQTGITPFAQGSNPRLAPDGTLYVAYEASVCETVACDQPADHDATVIGRSRDGGRTFQLSEVDQNFDFPTNPDVGRATLTGQNFRINSFPLLDIDWLTGRLWVTWADDRNGSYTADGQSIKTNGDAIVATSRDGRNWAVSAEGTSADEVFPAVTALANRVAVAYYTRTFDRNGIGLDYALQTGRGGDVGRKVRRITTETQNPQLQFISTGLQSGETLQGVFIGDYTAIAVGLDLRVHPVWVDFRGNPALNTPNQDIYTQSISLL